MRTYRRPCGVDRVLTSAWSRCHQLHRKASCRIDYAPIVVEGRGVGGCDGKRSRWDWCRPFSEGRGDLPRELRGTIEEVGKGHPGNTRDLGFSRRLDRTANYRHGALKLAREFLNRRGFVNRHFLHQAEIDGGCIWDVRAGSEQNT